MKIFPNKQLTVKQNEYFSKLMYDIRRDKFLYILLLPMLVCYILFNFLPMGGLLIAFKDYSPWKGIIASPWAGLTHFKEYFTSMYFARNLKNTLMINLYSLVFGFPIPIIFALLINEMRCNWFKKTIQTISYIPHFISVVVIAGMVTSFLSPSTGVINTLRSMLGFEKIYFLAKPEYFRTIYTMMNIWAGMGFDSIVYVAALAAVDQELYEACMIDGGGRWMQTWHITLPGIMGTVMIMLILKIGGIISVGSEQIILLYQPATYPTADVISTYIYRVGIESASPNYSLSAAVGLVNSLVSLILVWGANAFSKKFQEVEIW